MTVDGYQMNELVQPERGILLKAKYTATRFHAKSFFFDQHDFEKKIEYLLKMSA
jgi:hypothetical protein